MSNSNQNANVSLYAVTLASTRNKLESLKSQVDADCEACSRIDQQYHAEMRLLSLDLSRKIRTLTDWVNDLQHEYGISASTEDRR